VQQPKNTVGQLSMLLPEERDQILMEWSRPKVNCHYTGTIAQWVEAQARRTPDATALAFGNGRLTYHALNDQADKLSQRLTCLGAGPDIPIAFCLEQSMARIVTMLAIMKAGAAYVPIDTIYPPQRAAFILEDTRAPLLVTTTALKDRFSQFNGYMLVLDDQKEAAAIQARSAVPLSPKPPSDNLAYVLYTSGTTGQPKGVMIGHRALSNFIGEYGELMQIDAGSRLLQFVSIGFDVAAMEIWGGLSKGAAVYLYPDNRLTGASLYDFIKTHRITIAVLPPAVLATLPDPEEDCLTHLKTVVVAGEVMAEQVIHRWKDRVKLINGYGPTETTVCVNRLHITGSYSPSTIGRPISNTSFYILDVNGQPVPPCVTGELFIGGAQVARGYMNRPELTAERFIDNPFASCEEIVRGWHRLYKTGDLARYLPDGNIEYLGRNDQQVKIRGYRIELEEIEQVLTRQPDIRQAVALVWTDVGEKKIVAYLVHKAGKPAGSSARLTVDRMREALKQVLPPYMIPAAFVWLESIPLSASGKTDRNALPPPEKETPSFVSPLEKPNNDYEIAITTIWKEVLQMENINVKDNFFDLGGHSLLVTEVYSRLPEAWRQRLSLPDLFRHHTISALARHLHNN
jgi:amino acid adenylation domain-containing protein